MIILRK